MADMLFAGDLTQTITLYGYKIACGACGREQHHITAADVQTERDADTVRLSNSDTRTPNCAGCGKALVYPGGANW